MASSSRIDSLKKQYEENPRRYFAALANEYRKAGDLAQAIALCRQHLPQQPTHISGHIVFGQALFEAGELDEARTTFETALGLDPENLIALRHLGDIASQAGDPVAARDWYTRILHADPRNEEIQGLLRALPGDDADTAPAADERPAAPSEELGAWAADLAGEADLPAAPAAPPAPIAPRRPTPPMPSFTLDLSEPAQGADFEPNALSLDEPAAAPTPSFLAEVPLPPPPVTPPSAEAGDAGDFDLDFGTPAGNDLGLGVHLAATPNALPTGTPPIGMEAIFEEERQRLRGEPAGDVTPSTPNPADFGAGGADDASGADDHYAAEPLGGRNISEEMQAIFGAPADAEPATHVEDLGVEHMEFRAPERPPFDPSAFDDDAPAAAGGAGDTPTPFVTETMAELYLQQGFRYEALNVYRQLLAASPYDAALRERVRALEAEVADVGAPAAPATDEPPAFEPPAFDAPTFETPSYDPSDLAPSPFDDVFDEPTQAPASSWDEPPAAEPAAPATPSIPEAPRTAGAFFRALATRRAPARESLAEPSGEEADALARELAEPAHTSDPLAFEGSTATGLLGDHTAEVTGSDVAAGAPVAATPSIEEGATEAAVYHPALEEAPAPPARTSVPDMLAVAFADEPRDAREPAATAAPPAAPEAGAPAADFPEGSVDRLFGGRAVPARDETAAASLASAFTAEHEAAPSGRPTRPADGELSLDRVFRSPSRSQTPAGGGPVSAPTAPASNPSGSSSGRSSASFSFDQFFAEAGGAPSAAPSGGSADPGEVAASDIEQFNSWLEGLKKK